MDPDQEYVIGIEQQLEVIIGEWARKKYNRQSKESGTGMHMFMQDGWVKVPNLKVQVEAMNLIEKELKKKFFMHILTHWDVGIGKDAFNLTVTLNPK